MFDIGQRGQGGQQGKRHGKGSEHRVSSGLAALCLATALASTGAQAQERLTDADFLPVNEKAAQVGRLLFYDPILSGNRNISCGTCHHQRFGTSDGLSLGLGEGAHGLGPDRRAADGTVQKRIPRNAQALWNLGAREIRVLFHDGRLEKSDLYGNGFNSPAEEFLPRGLNSILAAQALFPMTGRFEMVGDQEDNEVSRAARRRIQEAWPLIATRVRVIPEYARMLMAAYPELKSPDDIEITHIVNALADFMNAEYKVVDTPFDRYLAGDRAALTPAQHAGMDLFFGKAGCSGCHSGKLLSDQAFHALALPPLGPGRTRRFDPVARDVGRMAETDRVEDAYRFRTPMLRNVALTAPYGHNGAYPTLEGIIRHHLDPKAALARWSPGLATLPTIEGLADIDFISLQNDREMARLAGCIDIEPRSLTDAEVAELVAFMDALTGARGNKGRFGTPATVPSGLEVDR